MRFKKSYRKYTSTRKRLVQRLERREKMTHRKHEKKEVPKAKEILPEQYFNMCNGMQLRNIHELAEKIEEIDDGVYSYHVNEEKNDFANWVKDVFDEPKLAEAMTKNSDRHKVHVALLKHLAFKK